MACTGIEFCTLAIVETKKRANDLVDELEVRLADINAQLESPIPLHLNSCARIQVADIGLKGQIVTDYDVNRVPEYPNIRSTSAEVSVRISSSVARCARTRWWPTNSATTSSASSRTTVDGRTDGETFGYWARRADKEVLR